MIVGVNDLFEWIKLNDTRYWRLFTYTKSSELGNSGNSENLTSQGSTERLSRLLDIHGSARYIIQINKAYSWNKGHLESTLEIIPKDGQPVNEATISGISIESVNAQVKEGIDKFKVEQELKLLIEENKELKKENQEANPLEKRFDSILGIIEPYIPQIMGFQKASVNVAGFEKEIEAAQEKVEKALTILNEIDPDLPQTLTKLASFAQRDPAKYNTYKNLLG